MEGLVSTKVATKGVGVEDGEDIFTKGAGDDDTENCAPNRVRVRNANAAVV